MSEQDCAGQVAFGTGARYGLGRAISEELMRSGAKVMLAGASDSSKHTLSGWLVAHTPGSM